MVWNPFFSREPVFPRPIPSVDPTMLSHPMPPECPSDSDGAAAGAVLMALAARQKKLLCALGHPVCVGGSLVSKRILEGSAVCFRPPILHRGKFSRASNEMGRRTHTEHLKARPSSPCWIHTSDVRTVHSQARASGRGGIRQKTSRGGSLREPGCAHPPLQPMICSLCARTGGAWQEVFGVQPGQPARWARGGLSSKQCEEDRQSPFPTLNRH